MCLGIRVGGDCGATLWGPTNDAQGWLVVVSSTMKHEDLSCVLVVTLWAIWYTRRKATFKDPYRRAQCFTKLSVRPCPWRAPKNNSVKVSTGYKSVALLSIIGLPFWRALTPSFSAINHNYSTPNWKAFALLCSTNNGLLASDTIDMF